MEDMRLLIIISKLGNDFFSDMEIKSFALIGCLLRQYWLILPFQRLRKFELHGFRCFYWGVGGPGTTFYRLRLVFRPWNLSHYSRDLLCTAWLWTHRNFASKLWHVKHRWEGRWWVLLPVYWRHPTVEASNSAIVYSLPWRSVILWDFSSKKLYVFLHGKRGRLLWHWCRASSRFWPSDNKKAQILWSWEEAIVSCCRWRKPVAS